MARATLVFSDVNTVSLEGQLDLLALESNFTSNLINVFRNILPELKSKISEIKIGFTNNNDSTQLIKNCDSLVKQLSPRLKYSNFSNYGKTLVSTPEGFKGTFTDYIVLLNKIIPQAYSEANTILGEYSFVLSTFITNKEDKISVKDHTDLFLRVKIGRNETLKEVNKFFPTSSSQTKTYLNNVINRFNDLDVLLAETKTLDKIHNQQSIRDLVDSTNKCAALLDIIIKNIQDGGVNNISGSAARNISEGAYEIAKYLEFIAALRFKTENILKSVENLIATLDRVIK